MPEPWLTVAEEPPVLGANGSLRVGSPQSRLMRGWAGLGTAGCPCMSTHVRPPGRRLTRPPFLPLGRPRPLPTHSANGSSEPRAAWSSRLPPSIDFLPVPPMFLSQRDSARNTAQVESLRGPTRNSSCKYCRLRPRGSVACPEASPAPGCPGGQRWLPLGLLSQEQLLLSMAAQVSLGSLFPAQPGHVLDPREEALV